MLGLCFSLPFFFYFYYLNRVESQVEMFYVHDTKKQTNQQTNSIFTIHHIEHGEWKRRQSHIVVQAPLSICCWRWVSVWSKSLPVCWSRPWNYLITTLNTVANCCLLIGQLLTAMTIWWEMIYPPAIFPWVMSRVKMITSFNHALFGWMGIEAKYKFIRLLGSIVQHISWVFGMFMWFPKMALFYFKKSK